MDCIEHIKVMKRNKPVYNGENWQDLSVSKVFDLNGITSNYIDDRYTNRNRKVLYLIRYFVCIWYSIWCSIWCSTLENIKKDAIWVMETLVDQKRLLVVQFIRILDGQQCHQNLVGNFWIIFATKPLIVALFSTRIFGTQEQF